MEGIKTDKASEAKIISPPDSIKSEDEHEDKKRKIDKDGWMVSQHIALIAKQDDVECATFYAHRGKLAADSAWYDRLAREASATQSAKDTVTLETTPQLLQMHTAWLYEGKNMFLTKFTADAIYDPTAHTQILCDLWLLGGKLDAERFQNAIADFIHHRFLYQHDRNALGPMLASPPKHLMSASPKAHPQLYRLCRNVAVNHGGGCLAHLKGQVSDFVRLNKAALDPNVMADLACELERCRDQRAALLLCQMPVAGCERFHRHEWTPKCAFSTVGMKGRMMSRSPMVKIQPAAEQKYLG